MPTRREFMHASGAAAFALATAAGGEQAAPGRAGAVAEVTKWDQEPTYLGRPARYWLGRLLDRNTVEYSPFEELNDSLREQTYDAVAAFGEQVLPELWRILLRGRDGGRRYALQVLSRMGTLGEHVLLDAAGDPRGNLRAAALATLAMSFPSAAPLPALLLAALDDEVQIVRLSAVDSLCWLGHAAKTILEQALRHEDPVIRRCGAQQILRIDPDRQYAEPLLSGLLHDPDVEVRWAAVQNVFCHLPVTADVVPVLLELLHAGCLAAANYLPFAGANGPAETLKLLEHTDVMLRAAASAALAEFICTRDPVPRRNLRELTTTEASDILLACRRAAQDNDLAVRGPAQRVVVAFEGQ